MLSNPLQAKEREVSRHGDYLDQTETTIEVHDRTNEKGSELYLRSVSYLTY